MAVIRWDPFTALARLDPEFDELVRRTWGAATAPRGGASGFVPAVEMTRQANDVLITVELPGVDVEKDVSIEVSEGRLVVSGERSERTVRRLPGDVRDGEQETADTSDDDRTLVRELRYGSFRREFALPEHVTGDDVEATYDQGMLRIMVHNVTRAAQSAQRVRIQAADQRRTITGTASPSSEGGGEQQS